MNGEQQRHIVQATGAEQFTTHKATSQSKLGLPIQASGGWTRAAARWAAPRGASCHSTAQAPPLQRPACCACCATWGPPPPAPPPPQQPRDQACALNDAAAPVVAGRRSPGPPLPPPPPPPRGRAGGRGACWGRPLRQSERQAAEVSAHATETSLAYQVLSRPGAEVGPGGSLAAWQAGQRSAQGEQLRHGQAHLAPPPHRCRLPLPPPPPSSSCAGYPAGCQSSCRSSLTCLR